jgi:hypothetical protein
MLLTHGRTGKGLYSTWRGIRGRCNDPKNVAYPYYGGRGISYDIRWDSFELFESDILNKLGPKPSKDHTIDRINNNDGYHINNVRWFSRAEQNINKRNNKVVTYKGVTKTLAEHCLGLDIKYATVNKRLSSGWSVDEAFTKPVRVSRAYQRDT